MADPKLDDLVSRAAVAASVDPLAHMREMMRTVGVVKVAAGGGDGVAPKPVPVARRGDPFSLVNVPIAAAPLNLVQGLGQIASRTMTPAGLSPWGKATVTQPAATGMHGFGQTTPLPANPTVPIPGMLRESPNPADSTQWVLDHIARQDTASPTVPASDVNAWFRRASMEGQDRSPVPEPPATPSDSPLSWPRPPCDEEEIAGLLEEASNPDRERAAKALRRLEEIASKDIECMVRAVIKFLHSRVGHRKWSGFLLSDVAVGWLLAYLAALLWTAWAMRPMFLGLAMMLLQWISNLVKDLEIDLSLPEVVVDALRGMAGEIPMGLQNSLVVAVEKYLVYLALQASGIAVAQEVLDALVDYIRNIVNDYK